MMTSWNGNPLLITGPLWGESPVTGGLPKKCQGWGDVSFDVSLLKLLHKESRTNNRIKTSFDVALMARNMICQLVLHDWQYHQITDWLQDLGSLIIVHVRKTVWISVIFILMIVPGVSIIQQSLLRICELTEIDVRKVCKFYVHEFSTKIWRMYIPPFCEARAFSNHEIDLACLE